MSHNRNIEPLGATETLRSPMLAQAFSLLSHMPADYLAAMLPVLATYVPRDPSPAFGARYRPRQLTIHWGRQG